MSMTLAYSLDWLAFSDPNLIPLSDIFDYGWNKPKLRKSTPLRGYDTVLTMAVGRVDWHSHLISQRRLWTLNGGDLRDLYSLGFEQPRLVREVCKIHDLRVSRADFAIDIKGASAKPSEVETAWHEGKVLTRAEKFTSIQSVTKDNVSLGQTVYIGSRSSPLFMRVYDKGAEQGTGEDWVRVEVEMKHPVATKGVREMDRLGIAQAGTAITRRVAEIPSIWWYTDALSGAGEADISTGRKVTDWEKWVTEIALPNVIKALEQDVPGMRTAIEGALSRPFDYTK